MLSFFHWLENKGKNYPKQELNQYSISETDTSRVYFSKIVCIPQTYILKLLVAQWVLLSFEVFFWRILMPSLWIGVSSQAFSLVLPDSHTEWILRERVINWRPHPSI